MLSKKKIDLNILLILKISVFIALICSLYIFISVFVFKDKYYADSFDSWQFPMLLALFSELFLN
jgi:hypothetical protein